MMPSEVYHNNPRYACHCCRHHRVRAYQPAIDVEQLRPVHFHWPCPQVIKGSSASCRNPGSIFIISKIDATILWTSDDHLRIGHIWTSEVVCTKQPSEVSHKIVLDTATEIFSRRDDGNQKWWGSTSLTLKVHKAIEALAKIYAEKGWNPLSVIDYLFSGRLLDSAGYLIANRSSRNLKAACEIVDTCQIYELTPFSSSISRMFDSMPSVRCQNFPSPSRCSRHIPIAVQSLTLVIQDDV